MTKTGLGAGLGAVALGLALLIGGPVSTAVAGSGCAALDLIDPDNDGALDFIEAKRAARATFNKLNNDGDRTLEPDEVAGRVSAAAFAAANPDGDGSLDIFEWKRLAMQRFRRANPDGDLTIECDELATPAGRALWKMLY